MREAILHLTDDQLDAIGLGDLVRAARDAGLRDLTELVCHGPGGVVLFRVDEAMPEDAFGDYPGVEWWERLRSDTDGVTYLCKVTAPGLPDDFDDLGVAHDVADVHADGVDLAVIGSQADIGDGVREAGAHGMDLRLRRLTEYRGGAGVLDALTERQREVVEAAYDAGFYDVPRTASTADVAADLDLDPSTVTEHRQRAERNLLDRLLGDAA